MLRCHKNFAILLFNHEMEQQAAKLFTELLSIGFVVGFTAGYAVRSLVSHHRRIIAKRSRMVIGLDRL